MNDNTIVACVGIAVGGVVTTVNLAVNGDGISVAALFTLIGTLAGYVFGKGQASKDQDTRGNSSNGSSGGSG